MEDEERKGGRNGGRREGGRQGGRKEVGRGGRGKKERNYERKKEIELTKKPVLLKQFRIVLSNRSPDMLYCINYKS